MTTPAPVYTPNIDPGMVRCNQGAARSTGPFSGRPPVLLRERRQRLGVDQLLSAKSDNIASFAAPASVYKRAIDSTATFLAGHPGDTIWRGVLAAWQTYGDNVLAKNHRGQFSAWFLF
jgi:hypothetical protein